MAKKKKISAATSNLEPEQNSGEKDSSQSGGEERRKEDRRQNHFSRTISIFSYLLGITFTMFTPLFVKYFFEISFLENKEIMWKMDSFDVIKVGEYSVENNELKETFKISSIKLNSEEIQGLITAKFRLKITGLQVIPGGSEFFLKPGDQTRFQSEFINLGAFINKVGAKNTHIKVVLTEKNKLGIKVENSLTPGSEYIVTFKIAPKKELAEKILNAFGLFKINNQLLNQEHFILQKSERAYEKFSPWQKQPFDQKFSYTSVAFFSFFSAAAFAIIWCFVNWINNKPSTGAVWLECLFPKLRGFRVYVWKNNAWKQEKNGKISFPVSKPAPASRLRGADPHL